MTIIGLIRYRYPSSIFFIIVRREALGARGFTLYPLDFRLTSLRIRFLGDYSEGETPVPIPNTVVKPLSADGTAWEAAWESRTSPRLNLKPAGNSGFFFGPRTGGDSIISLRTEHLERDFGCYCTEIATDFNGL